MTEITVFIMNYNGMEYLPMCFSAMREQAMKANMVFMDNNSTDGSWELGSELCTGFGWQAFRSDRNRYVAYLEREAIRMCRTKYAAFCHIDCVPERDWLKKLYEIAEKENAGAVEPEIIHPNGQVLHGTLTGWFSPKLVDCEKYPVVVSTCATLYRNIGKDLFDSSYFHYHDESYASEVLKRNGYILVHDRECKVKHVGSHSGLLGLRWKILSRFNQARMVLKFHGPAKNPAARRKETDNYGEENI